VDAAEALFLVMVRDCAVAVCCLCWEDCFCSVATTMAATTKVAHFVDEMMTDIQKYLACAGQNQEL
jgi:hypothetical protein